MESSAVYIIIGISAFLWIVGILFLSRHSTTLQLFRRAIALFAGISGLILLIIQPKYTELQVPVNVHLGPNISKNDSLALHFDNVHDLINDPIYDRIDTINIHEIVSSEDLQLLRDIPLSWEKPDSLWGIIDIVPNRYFVNEENKIDGQFAGDIATIILQAPDDQLYPATISDSSFRISWTPKLSGAHIYKLISIASTGDTIMEQFPLHILPEAKWNLLALLAYPSADFKQMKNYWTQLGHGIASRTQICLLYTSPSPRD